MKEKGNFTAGRDPLFRQGDPILDVNPVRFGVEDDFDFVVDLGAEGGRNQNQDK
ncbi:MAG: hypothetical protein MPW14_06465 [Candidatus Manganitrophus sp.]|nr:MAG: hypothetical protein MPW14_06465 [Candidatus Manganitrophus sp.]